MLERLSRYMVNSMKVAIIGFCWFILFQVPYERLPDAPTGGKVLVCVMLWATWSFMVMIVGGDLDKDRTERR